jgi:hypothetical protein
MKVYPSSLLPSLVTVLLFAAPLAAGEPAGPPADAPPAALCFAPDTPAEYVEEMTRRFGSGANAIFQATHGITKFQLTNRWSVTATDGPGLVQGDPTTITWSYLPDGVQIGGFAGEPASPSDFQAWMNGIYGSFAVWHALFVQVFDRWGELTGNTYVYEPNDDGAPFPGSPGVLGVRGDVRIGGHLIDGNSGILAYNFFPNTGDMVLDSADNFYDNTTSNSLRLRNVVAHEHGHGMGLLHVCPINQTKLMEPFFSMNFDGPQFDDLLGAQRHYGDFFEHNDTSGTATDLGFFSSGTGGFEDELSVDDDSDQNFYEFTTDPGQLASVTLAPPGVTPYPQGPQNQQTGACSLPTPIFDPNVIHDLGVDLLDSDGTTVIASANSQPAGGTEMLSSVALPSGGGPYFIRVFGDATNNIQAYELTLDVDPVAPCTPRNGTTNGKWDLPLAGGTASGELSGTLVDPTGARVYSFGAKLIETSSTGGDIVGALSDGVAPDPDYDVVGTYTITVPATHTSPAAGTWIADIFTAGTNNQVGATGGRWKDFPAVGNVGAYRGRWRICD